MTSECSMRLFLPLGLLLPTIAAAVPLELAHQGRLMDDAGTPLDGRHALDLALYDSEGAVVPVYAEGADIDFIEGFYSMRLGSDGTLDHDVLAAGDLWLGLSVDGGLELPRIPLAAAPYARQADLAREVRGGPVDATELRINGVVVIDGAGELAIPGDGDTLADLGCAAGEVAVSSGFGWVCAPMASEDTLADLSCGVGEVAVWNGLGWVCGLPPGDGDALGELVCDSAETPVWNGFDWECRPWGDSDTLASLGCDPGQVAAYDGAAWACLDVVDRDTLAAIGCDAGDVALYDGAGWVCQPLGDADTLAGLLCSDGQVARYDAPARLWGCADDATVDEGMVEAWIRDEPIDLAPGSTIGGASPLGADDLSWGAILGVPADLRDGDADALAGLECEIGEVVSWDSGWGCAVDMMLTDVQVRAFVVAEGIDLHPDTTIGGRALVSGDELVWSNVGGKPPGFADGTDDDSFAGVSCDPGQILVWDAIVGFDCATPAISGDTLADLSLICEDGDVPYWDDGGGEWNCGPDMVLSAPDVIGILAGEDLALGGGTTIGGSAVLTEEEALSIILDAGGLGEGVLPFNGLNEISNGLLTNQFIEGFDTLGSPIPDNSPPGVLVDVELPDIGIAEWLTVSYVIDNSDVSGLTIDLTAPDGTNYLLYDGERAGGALAQVFPTVDSELSGDLTEWVGLNPAGTWTLHVVDDDFLNNEIDGEVTSFAIEFQHVSNQQVALSGDLLISDTLTVDADAYIAGNLGVGGTLDVGGDADFASDVTVHGNLNLDNPVELPAGTTFDGVPIEQVSKALYTHWGRSDCPDGADVVYSGMMGAGYYNHSGGSTDYYCLPESPEFLSYNDSASWGGIIYGTEYQTNRAGHPDNFDALNDYDGSCAVCLTNASVTMMQPGRITCPDGWNQEYQGYLMGEHY
ncbi:MAG: subtilisin-like proprotein convertase family protein, partial [Myxococcota bacterium]